MKNVHIATYQDAAAKLANTLPAFKENVVVRLGGTKRYDDYAIQINTIAAVNNSIDKRTQKNLLLAGGIATLPLLEVAEYPCVVKGVVRSCGTKVFVARNVKEFKEATAKLNDYLIEPLFEATSEYRLHCDRKECFFSVKKFKRNPDDVIINHENHYNKREFVKPRLWKEIQAECVKAMKVLDLDIACFDVLYSSKNDLKHTFVIAEANTNPELLANTFNAYNDKLIQLINEKIAAHKPALKAAEAKKAIRALTPAQELALINSILTGNYHLDGEGEYVTIKL